MQKPFELTPNELQNRLDEMVEVTISNLVSEFLLMPMGEGFIKYPDFRSAYEVLKRQTSVFTNFSESVIARALRENSRVLGVLRAILGMTSPEWAELARTELNSDITQGAARTLDRKCRDIPDYISAMDSRYQAQLDRAKKAGKSVKRSKSLERIDALVKVAVQYIIQGAPEAVDDIIHRLDKFDTKTGIDSVQYAAKENIPYAVLLYERYLGRPFACHRDAVSELVGEVMENAVEERLRSAGVTYRKTKRAERIPGFGIAPDFCIPDEVNPVAVIEAKITSDDGTARDKVTRIKELETQRNKHVESGRASYEVIACIDGRGFRERREDMRQLLLRLSGKVFTTATLSHITTHTRIKGFVSL
ncbi:MAG: hypothetical protein HY893_00880 [Deltaproteobacteria bacterium]|nr:hypothetical protein [Deltaproteobacteria bacterium]